MVKIIETAKRQFLLIQNACANGQIEMERKEKTLIEECLTTHSKGFSQASKDKVNEEERATPSQEQQVLEDFAIKCIKTAKAV